MTDQIRNDESTGRDSTHSGNRERSSVRNEPGRRSSPLGTDPQEASPLPGDPRDAQEPQEPRTTHIGTGDHEVDNDRGVVDQLKEAWDRMRGK
jgi:hypothetical protein